MTLTGKLPEAEEAVPAKVSADLITAISLPETARVLNLISGIFLKTFSADREAEGRKRKGARILR